ncbi:hypothetical protein AAFN47_17530 [Hoeflea sp. CAU 1731]
MSFALAGQLRYVGWMHEDRQDKSPKSAADKRKERLADALRANLQRRKQQVRARRKGAMDDTAGLPASEGEKS